MFLAACCGDAIPVKVHVRRLPHGLDIQSVAKELGDPFVRAQGFTDLNSL